MSDFDGAIVLVSHDRHLIGLVCETFWRVADGRVEAFDGDLDEYAAWLRSRGGKTDKRTRRRSRPHAVAAPKPARSKQAIDATDKRIKQIEARMADARIGIARTSTTSWPTRPCTTATAAAPSWCWPSARAQLAGERERSKPNGWSFTNNRRQFAMPIYAFECGGCGHHFDRLQRLSDADPTHCPECDAAKVRRQLTAPSFRLAGGGWYETDFKKDGEKAQPGRQGRGDTGQGPKPSAEAKVESKPETKAAARRRRQASNQKPPLNSRVSCLAAKCAAAVARISDSRSARGSRRDPELAIAVVAPVATLDAGVPEMRSTT